MKGGLSSETKQDLLLMEYQEEGIDYDEVFATVARIEAIRMFLAYASYMGFMVYQMDVKSTFLYGQIEEEVYVCQPLGFEDPDHPDKVYKVVKALYGLHQAPRAWYDTLANYLLSNRKRKHFYYVKIKYVNEVLRKFNYRDVKSASTPTDLENPLVQDRDAADVDEHLYRSMIGSLMYLTTSRPDIMFAVCACARFQVSTKTSHLLAVKRTFRYLKGKPSLGLWYSKDSPLELVSYTDSDYAGATQDMKSTTRGSLDTKPTAGLWIRHHFIRDCNAKKLIQMAKIDTEHNVADLLTKGFDAGRFQYLVSRTANASTDTDGEGNNPLAIHGCVNQDITEASLENISSWQDHMRATDQAGGKQGKRGKGFMLSGMKKMILSKGGLMKTLTLLLPQDDEIVHDQDTAAERQLEDSTAGITVSTAPINISTARESHSTAGRVVYGRRSKEARKDKGKEIMTEPEPVKKSKKLLEQERLGLEEAIRLQEKIDEEERAQVARDEEIARQLLALDEERVTTDPKTTKDVDWNDPSVQKYWDMKNKPNRSEARRKKIVYLRHKKKQKVELNDEKEDLKGYLDIVPREDVAVNVDSLSTKYPLLDWKTYTLSEKFMYYKIIRGDGSSKNYKILSEMLYDFDRQDIMELYRLVKERVYILLMQNGIAIHMLTEKKYPLSQEMISKMLSKRLEVDQESTQAYELLKFISLDFLTIQSTGSEGFHQFIDFLRQSHISYALTKKPEIYISFIKQFWRTVEASTDTDGEVTITAIIDGQSKTITEASLRRNLLEDTYMFIIVIDPKSLVVIL
ncbi:retrovirus-related pol polyprotein from transposon TNT 1-94 [Tanacetum coccineum]